LHDLLIRDVSVADVRSRRIAEHQDVAVDGPLIAAVGATGNVGRGQRVLNGHRRLVMPGLVNCHTHSPMSLLRGTLDMMPLRRWLPWVASTSARYEEDDIYWASLLSICQMLKAGVTTFADMHIREHVVAKAVEEAGIRAFLSEAVGSAMGYELRGSYEDQIGRAEALVRDLNGAAGGRIVTGIAPRGVYDCSVEQLREVAELAKRTGCRVHTHLAETTDEVEGCLAAYGRRPPQLLADCGLFDVPLLAAHSVHLDDRDLELYVEHGVCVSHNPGSNLRLRSGVAPVPELIAAGIRVGIGTDSAASNDSLDLWRDCYLAAVLHAWPEHADVAWTVLEMATTGGAAALRMADEIGVVAAGWKADLTVIDIDRLNLAPATDVARTLTYSMRGDEVTTVVVDGRVLVEDGRMLELDEEAIIDQCRRRARRILGVGVVD
jgi:5-methylthioadenosine/S-adenosylhomocysteine deaminase